MMRNYKNCKYIFIIICVNIKLNFWRNLNARKGKIRSDCYDRKEIWMFDNNGEEMEEESRKLSTPVIELHRVDRLLSNLRHNARAQSASVTRNKQGWAVYEVCVVAQSMGDPGQLAIKPETRCPVVDHAPWGYVSTRIGTVIVSFDHPSRVYPCTTSRKEIFVMKVAIG